MRFLPLGTHGGVPGRVGGPGTLSCKVVLLPKGYPEEPHWCPYGPRYPSYGRSKLANPKEMPWESELVALVSPTYRIFVYQPWTTLGGLGDEWRSFGGELRPDASL